MISENHRLAVQRIKTVTALNRGGENEKRENHRLALQRIKTLVDGEPVRHLEVGENHRLALQRTAGGVMGGRPALNRW